MRAHRHLGSVWASVHGPHDVRRLLTWALDQHFVGILFGPGPRALDPGDLRAAATDLPIDFSGARAGSFLAESSATAGLASAKEGERAAAARVVQQAVAASTALGSRLVMLEPGVVPVMGEIENDDLGDPAYDWTEGRTQALLARRKANRNAATERACRSLFAILKAFPDMEFALCGGRNLRSVADLDGLRDIYDDLHHPRLGYWHDAAVAARREQVLGEGQGEWLEAFGNRLRGCSLGDSSPDGMYLPPGAGGVDYGLLASYLPRTGAVLPAVLELDPSVAPGEMPGMLACLTKHGL